MPQPCAEVWLEKPKPRAKYPPVRELRVIQAEYSHEIAVLSYPYDADLHAALRKGKPVMIRWGWATETAKFVGYVHHVSLEQRPDREDVARFIRVVCVGATDPLNAPAFRQYRATRVDAVVSDVVRSEHFSALIERHDYAWPLLQQEGESTWAFLVGCARKVGWTLYPRGTDIRCHSRVIRFSGAVPLKNHRGDYTPERGGIYSFDIVQAETLNSGAKKRQRVVRGVNAQGVVFTAIAGIPAALSGVRALDTGLVEYRSSSAVSIGEAEALLRGEQEANRHHVCAKATTSGDARIHPATSVRLAGVDNDSDGYWFVTRAEHVITQTTYRCALELGTDSLGDPGGTSTRRAVPGDTAGRMVVNRGTGVNAVNLEHSAPPPLYPNATGRVIPVVAAQLDQRWRAQAPLERELPPVVRPAPVRVPPPLASGSFEVLPRG